MFELINERRRNELHLRLRPTAGDGGIETKPTETSDPLSPDGRIETAKAAGVRRDGEAANFAYQRKLNAVASRPAASFDDQRTSLCKIDPGSGRATDVNDIADARMLPTHGQVVTTFIGRQAEFKT